MSKQFSEATRVQVPAILHLTRLGYTYLPDIVQYDSRTNILTDIFSNAVKRLNPGITDQEILLLIDKLARIAKNDDLGREFYKNINDTSGIKLIDFDNADNNDWHCTAEFTCKDEASGDNFRPDITCFVNGLPLAFIEVKVPNNKDGILAERKRMNDRMRNKKFRPFLNVTQMMIFSNNQEYDTENRVPIHGAFYASIAKDNIFFNVFREQKQSFYDNMHLNPINQATELSILKKFNCTVISNIPEYQTNKQPSTPTNRVLSSMISRDRFLFLLHYGIAYVNKTKKLPNNEVVEQLQKHIMRYQQLFASLAIRRKLDDGIKSGIIWHTQGSGKTALAFYSIKSLTDYLAKKNTVAKFYFIVDRLDLLEQATKEFKARGLFVRTAESRNELMADIKKNVAKENNEGLDEIMVVNIQLFKEDHEKVDLSNGYNTNLQRVFFIDEAHRGYNPRGSFLANLLDADRNAIKIALTGTPLLREERASWKVFGDYIDKYYYDKSIADGYTLKLMREDIETSYKETLIRIIDDFQIENPKVKRGDVTKDIIIESDNYINALLDYVVKDFRRFRKEKGDKTVGGMIVCETNPQARRIKEAFDDKMRDDAQPLQAALILHDEGDRDERKEQIDSFKDTTQIDLLIVNRMLLTGFDADRLKRMYLTRKMTGHDLLQALTRVNRPYKDFKYGYVVDFANIKENFDETNNLYLHELNRNEDGEEHEGDKIGESILEDPEAIKEQLREIQSILFAYNTNNTEEFSRQIDNIENAEILYSVRHQLENARALSNQIRCANEQELRKYYEQIDLGNIGDMLSVVNKRIDAINRSKKIEHEEEVSDVVNLILDQLHYEFKLKGSEVLSIYNNDIVERAEKVRAEFNRNFDHDELAYKDLVEEFRRYFREKGFIPIDVADAKMKIGYIDDVMRKIKAINQKNEVLLSKYKGDEKFTRVHKRIMEENISRSTQGKKPIISAREVEIAQGLNRLKDWIDEMVFLNQDILRNEAAFEQDVLAQVSQRLLELNIAAAIDDRKFIKHEIANEYYAQYEKLINPSQNQA